MAKGMNMDEFRNALASEARDENETLKKELKREREKSSKEIQELREELNKYKDCVRVLANRCFVHTKGLMCLYCDLNSDACKYLYTQNEMDEAVDYMDKNHIKRTEENKEKMHEFLYNLRQKRLTPKNNFK